MFTFVLILILGIAVPIFLAWLTVFILRKLKKNEPKDFIGMRPLEQKNRIIAIIIALCFMLIIIMLNSFILNYVKNIYLIDSVGLKDIRDASILLVPLALYAVIFFYLISKYYGWEIDPRVVTKQEDQMQNSWDEISAKFKKKKH